MGDSENQVVAPTSSPSSVPEVQQGGKLLSSSDDSGVVSEGKERNQKEGSSDVAAGVVKESDPVSPQEANAAGDHDNDTKNSSLSNLKVENDSAIASDNCPNNSDAIQTVSSPCEPSQGKTDAVQDNPTLSLDSSPTTPSTSGQDSGVSLISPDDSSWETAAGGTAKLLGAEAAPDQQSKGETDPKDTVQEQSVDSSIEKDLTTPAEASPPDDQQSGTSENKTENSSMAASAAASSDQVSVYYIKWVLFGTSKVPIITQNENGPCPLLAIMNVLLLKGKVTLAPMLEMVTSEQLMAYLADCIFDNMPQNLPAVTKANYEQNMQDAMGVMDKLQTGLDVNVRFTGVGDFEYTSEMIIFDLLEISLYHGWLVDPQDSSAVQAINQCSYNQLVEKIISLKQSENETDVTKGLIAEQFLDRTASQLTYHGLCELSSVIKDSELCVFFRNNHFNTLYKHNNELFLLVTDQGFLTENNVVWETLSNVDGDGHFVDASFRTYTKPLPPTQPIPDPSVPVGSPEQIDHDYQVALSLQEEDVPAPAANWPADQNAAMLADHEYALRLQEQENQRAAQEQQQVPPFGGQAAGPAAQGQAQGRAHPPSSSQAEAQRRRAPERPEKKEKEGKDEVLNRK